MQYTKELIDATIKTNDLTAIHAIISNIDMQLKEFKEIHKYIKEKLIERIESMRQAENNIDYKGETMEEFLGYKQNKEGKQ